ncbi:UDP-N-acetylglucosamine 1-carboxyvinyltransferase [Thiovulum sp. ES]|nr:UDP-N-acetylglucosamine 1-carboxyvinyltransferase [Thiovulum sp. ES]
MEALKIIGGNKLSGNVEISGAKNSALPLIASTILAKNSVKIENVPNVVDIKTLLKLLDQLGGNHKLEKNSLIVDTSNLKDTKATYEIVKTMRASILVLGPLLARFRECEVSLPGGCAIGARPVDLHLKALEEMGAEISIEAGYIKAVAPNGLVGAKIDFAKKSVTGTENIVMAGALANGKTTILNSALEPEVIQLCEVLRDSGVEISGIGTDKLEIVGTNGKLLDFPEIRVIPDRIEAGTYLCAGAITGGTVSVSNVEPEHLKATTDKLQEIGFNLEIEKEKITISNGEKLKAVDIITAEYPHFPTDMQAQFVALLTQIDGESIVEERLFENRFMHVVELQRLGAKIEIDKNQVEIFGKTDLIGADVMATDLRASSALVLAGLVASGETTVHRIYHLHRGYENLEEKLLSLGAKVKKVKVSI